MQKHDLLTSWDDYKKWWVHRDDQEEGDSSTVHYDHHPFISTALNISNTVIAVIEIKSMKYKYHSPNWASFLGWADEDFKKGGVQFSFSLVPPNDQRGAIALSELITTYFQKLPMEQKAHYTSFWDFRIQRSSGEYVKLLQQECALKYDTTGHMTEKLIFVSIIGNIISHDSQHLRLTNGKENFFYKFDHKHKAVVQLQLLTDREMEVVKWVAKSLSANEIADHLNISAETVRAHNRNIRKKLKVSDSLEMVTLLRTWGFI